MMAAASIAALAGVLLAGPATAPDAGTNNDGGIARDGDAAGDAARLVAEWAAAQNGGDFKRYSALYATSFTGIRRVKDRSERLNRAKWLAGRKPLFAKPLPVSVTDVSDKEAAGRVEVTFTQVASGSPGEFGRKAMTLERTPAGLRIAREEMLSAWSLPRAIAVEETQAVAPDFYDPRDALDARQEADCDDCGDYDNACGSPRGLTLMVNRGGKALAPLTLDRACKCLCGMHDESANAECGCDAVGWTLERSIRLGDRTFAIVQRTARHTRTRTKIDETRVSYHLYGYVCGEIRELLMLWERDRPTSDGYTITAAAPDATGWRALTVTDRDGPRAQFTFPDRACGFRAAK